MQLLIFYGIVLILITIKLINDNWRINKSLVVNHSMSALMDSLVLTVASGILQGDATILGVLSWVMSGLFFRGLLFDSIYNKVRGQSMVYRGTVSKMDKLSRKYIKDPWVYFGIKAVLAVGSLVYLALNVNII